MPSPTDRNKGTVGMKKSDNSMASHSQPLRLLLDTPELEVVFHFDEYARVLARAIVDSGPHLTVGIFGPWGKGKTTLLEKVRTEIERRSADVIVVPFEAWRYQHEPHMVLPMLEMLEEVLMDRKGAFQKLGSVIGRLSKAFAYSIKVNASFVEVSPGEGLNKLDEKVKTDYYQWQRVLRNAVNELRKETTEARIVFLIDDVDRCLPHKAVEVLEAIKVMLDVDGFVFVLALDRDVIENAVEAHYGRDYAIKGDLYIKKIVQVEFTLPPLRSQDVREYVKTLQEKLPGLDTNLADALKNVISEIAQDNPREVKRFVNSTLIANAIVTEAGIQVPPECQVAFMGLRFRWPGFAEQLREQVGLAKSVRSFLEGGTRATPEAMSAIKSILENYPGLEAFLRTPVSASLLQLSSADLEQLIFYAAVVEKAEAVSEEGPRGSRFESFSETARRALTFAKEEAQRFNHKYIGTEHILLGLLHEDEGVAAKVLTSLGVDLNKVRAAVEFIIGRGEMAISAKIDLTLGLTPRGKRVIEFALDEAHRLNRDYVGTEHLLLGLLRDSEGIAAGVLEGSGITLDNAREEVKRLLL